MSIISVLLLACSIWAEWAAIVSLLQNELIFFLIEHVIAAILFLVGMRFLLETYYSAISWWLYGFIFLLIVSMPVVGLITSILFVSLQISLRGKSHRYSERVEGAIDFRKFKLLSRQYGAGGAFLTVQEEGRDVSSRMEALLILGRVNVAAVNESMNVLLSDKSDEIRLLAFNLLDQQESMITKEIDQLTSLLQHTKHSAHARAKLEKNIAILYWELIYRQLVMRELRGAILQNAKRYARAALTVLQQDATLWALLGKINLRMQEDQQAEEALKKAMDFHVAPLQVLPYLAEIEYKKRNFVAMGQWLQGSLSLLDNAKTAAIRHVWDAP